MHALINRPVYMEQLISFREKQIIKVDDRNKYVSIVFVIIGISLIVCAILVAVLYKARNKYK